MHQRPQKMYPPRPGESSLQCAARIFPVRRTEHALQLRPLGWRRRGLYTCTHRHAGPPSHAPGNKRGSTGTGRSQESCPKTQALNARKSAIKCRVFVDYRRLFYCSWSEKLCGPSEEASWFLLYGGWDLVFAIRRPVRRIGDSESSKGQSPNTNETKGPPDHGREVHSRR